MSRKFFTFVIQFGLVILALGTAVVYAKHLLETGPKSTKRKKEKRALLVEIETLVKRDWPIVVDVVGTVIPSHTIELKSRVAGEVISTGGFFYPGGSAEEGEVVVQLDDKDIQIEIKRQKAALIQAQANLRIEEGQQQYAKTEYDLNQRQMVESERDLMLRVPYRVIREAQINAEEAQMEKLRLDWQRTQIKSPFPAFILEKSVDIGAWVSPGTVLATLVDRRRVWVEFGLAMDNLQWVDFPVDGEGGSTGKVFVTGLGDSVCWEGRLLGLVGDVEKQGRLARVLFEVERLKEGTLPLLLNSSVKVKIQGKGLSGVFAIPRPWVHDGDTLWVYDAGKLKVVAVKVLFRGENHLIVREGIEDGVQVVTTLIAAPAQGMDLRLPGQPDGTTPVAKGSEK